MNKLNVKAVLSMSQGKDEMPPPPLGWAARGPPVGQQDQTELFVRPRRKERPSVFEFWPSVVVIS